MHLPKQTKLVDETTDTIKTCTIKKEIMVNRYSKLVHCLMETVSVRN